MNDFLKDFEPLYIPINGVRLPIINVSNELKSSVKIDNSSNNFAFLRALCLQGFKNLNLKKDSAEYKNYADRVKYELEIVNELGFTDYFLLVWKVINFCTEKGIPVGMGRGSAVGSLVLFLIGVVKIDPIKYGLYFERFISKIRAKKQVIDGITYLDGSLMPDVDMDICYYRRHEVIEYLATVFKSKTSKILTFNTLSSKLLIKEVGKTLGLKSEEEMTDVTSMIPKLHGQVLDVEKAYEEVVEFKAWCDANPELYENAMKLKDLIKNKGVHPSGIMISYDNLEDSCPVELTSDKDIVSSYSMDLVSLFTIKLDVLGLRGVSVVDDVCKHLKIRVENIDIHDEFIYQNVQDLKTPHGLFQIEADLGYRTTQKVKPKNFNDLSAILALARPGAMQFIDQYALYTNTGTYEVLNVFFEDILKETGGVCLYQEQLLKMTHKLGFTLDEAEIVRRVVGKKKVEEMVAWEKKIYDKCKENNLSEEVGKVLWRIMDDSKDYSFNRSHCAAYSALTAITIYLKFKYPQEFYLSLLRMTKHEPDPITEISKIHKEMHLFGIELLCPCLVKSKINFSIEGKNIRFGLSSIKGIAEKAVIKLEDFKREHANKLEMFQAAKKAGLSIGIVSAMIQAGALQSFVINNNRSLLVYEAQLWNKLSLKEKQAAMKIAASYNYKLPAIIYALCEIKDEKGKSIIKCPLDLKNDLTSKCRINTIRKNTNDYRLIYDMNKKCQDFANWWYEKKLLGFNGNSKLRDIFLHKLPTLIPIDEAMEMDEEEQIRGRRSEPQVIFIGYIDENPKLGTSKKGSRYAKYSISDETGTAKVMIFNDPLEACKTLNGRLPKEEDIVIVKGKRMGQDAVFAEHISIQNTQIYTRLADLKDTSKDEEMEISPTK